MSDFTKRGNDKHCVCGFPDERGVFFPTIWSGRNAVHLGFKFFMKGRNVLECIQCFMVSVSCSKILVLKVKLIKGKEVPLDREKS